VRLASVRVGLDLLEAAFQVRSLTTPG
jgi:hypothetical protein